MPKFTVTVTETYTNTFDVEAANAGEAEAVAEEMAIERQMPSGNIETCNRSVDVAAAGV